MHAFALDEFGDTGSIHEVPTPEPIEGHIVVRIHAASINPFDTFVTKGFLKDRMEHHFPLIPCSDLSGTVEAIGPGVSGLARGDEVFGVTGRMVLGEGTLAEYAIASPATVARRPAKIDPVSAAALPLAGVSALMSVDAVAPKQGDVVVVIGASGGIGGYAVQLAAMRQAHVVGVTSTPHVDYVKSLGAAETIDRLKSDVAAALRAKFPNGVDAIIDTTSDAPTLAGLTAVVKDGGAVTSMRGAANAEELQKRDIRATNIQTQTTTERLEHLSQLVVDGKLKPGLIHRFKLDDAAKGLALIGQSAGGKIVITVG